MAIFEKKIPLSKAHQDPCSIIPWWRNILFGALRSQLFLVSSSLPCLNGKLCTAPSGVGFWIYQSWALAGQSPANASWRYNGFRVWATAQVIFCGRPDLDDACPIRRYPKVPKHWSFPSSSKQFWCLGHQPKKNSLLSSTQFTNYLLELQKDKQTAGIFTFISSCDHLLGSLTGKWWRLWWKSFALHEALPD